MLTYLTLLFVVIAFVHLADKARAVTFESRLYLFVAFVAMVLVAGVRDKSVGTDAWSYVYYFDMAKSFSDAIEMGSKTKEYGFPVIMWLVHLVSDEYAAFFTAMALIVVGCYQRAIVVYSANITISFFVFITMGFYTFFFNGLRQGIACAICSLAIGPLQERKFFKYLGIILIATLFHKTAIIMLPVYLIFNKSNTFKTNLFYGLIGIAGSLSLQTIVNLSAQVDERYQSFAATDKGGGYIMVGFYCALTFFFLLFKKRVLVEREQYDLFLNMLIFGSVIALVSAFARVDPSGILRLSLYFNVSAIFLWPIVFNNLRNPSLKMLASFVFVTGHIILFALTTERFSNLIPYTFNPTLPFM